MRKVACAALAGLLCMAPSAPSVRIVEGDGIVTGSVNGVPARIRIDPGALAIPIVSAALASRAGLRPGFMQFEYKVGSQAVSGSSAVGMIDIGTGAVKRRIGWARTLPQPGGDGAIGPGLLKEDVVGFRLRAERVGERKAVFPLADQGGIEARWGERYALLTIGNSDLRIQFDPHRRDTVATAQAGSLLAAALNGNWNGASREAVIAFGVARPVRTLVLTQPLAIGPLALTRIAVRTHDFGSTTAIRETAADPNEIVVTGTKASKSPYSVLRLGGDVLADCSSIVFDRRAKRVTLSCL